MRLPPSPTSLMVSRKARRSMPSSTWAAVRVYSPASSERNWERQSVVVGGGQAFGEHPCSPDPKRHRSRRPCGAAGSMGAVRRPGQPIPTLPAFLRGDGDRHRQDLRLPAHASSSCRSATASRSSSSWCPAWPSARACSRTSRSPPSTSARSTTTCLSNHFVYDAKKVNRLRQFATSNTCRSWSSTSTPSARTSPAPRLSRRAT